MKVVKSVKEMHLISGQLRLDGKKIGFVPTMGYLHEGHLSLVRKSKENSDITVVSIFVNPTQFAPTEDLDKYPRDFERDEMLLNQENVDFLFYPDKDEIYPEGFSTFVEVGEITKVLEGESRPNHFKGVTTIVSILFNIVKPHYSVFGQKDAQQASVIRKMTSDLHFDIEIEIAPIVREKDGLAMSSRNVYLNQKEREDALVLSKSLYLAEDLIKKGERDFNVIKEKMIGVISQAETAYLDYIQAVESDSFSKVNLFEKGKSYFVLIACRIGRTRLIDNLLIQIN
ncbi:MAG: pantoate--beta-alanine ligase [Ignavibacteriae bacterium]|nr:pantoate--beta-alanine ligase [Ignavibacteriota bacterium]